MPRSGDEARQRLQHAALHLFGEQGYENTTTAQIAARAGVTERTYFRHFVDKREVLFDGQEPFRADLVTGLAAAPDGPALLMLFHAYRASFALLEHNRPFAEPRFHVIAATPALQEREAAKLASVNRALTEALVARGVEAALAALATEVGMAAFSQATTKWIAEPPPGDLDAHLRRAFADLAELAGDLAVPRARRTHPGLTRDDRDASQACIGSSLEPH